MNPEKKTQGQESVATKTKATVNWKVVLYNDESHTYDYVVEVLTKCCKITKEQAFKCAVEVDLTGRTTVYYGSKEDCQGVSDCINAYGPDFRMPNSLGSMESAVEGFN